MLEVLFYISLFGIFHTYILYPLFLHLLGIFKRKAPLKTETFGDEAPAVEIVFAAYNEEEVIFEKIERSFKTRYPLQKVTVRMGSDASTDGTDEIVRELQKKYTNLHFKTFPGRTGKSGILNELVKESRADLLILTDANILFEEDTIPNLVSAMQDEKTGIAGGYILYSKVSHSGISYQESFYLKWENAIKALESRLFGAVIGVEGGCYIIRRELFPDIPRLFFMEDFYVTLSVIKRHFKARFVPEARCFEDVSIDHREEFRRKVRISVGNFQNLFAFGSLVFTRFFPTGFALLSHKILRWFTPFLLILLLITSIGLAPTARLYGIFAGIYMIFLALGLFGILLSGDKKNGWLKYPGHFIYMNMALLKGFFVYLKGVESNVWQPTRRNQQ